MGEDPCVLLPEGVLYRFFKGLVGVNLGCQISAFFPEVVVGGEACCG